MRIFCRGLCKYVTRKQRILLLFLLVCFPVMAFFHLAFCNECVCQVYSIEQHNIKSGDVVAYDYYRSEAENEKITDEDECKSCGTRVNVPEVIIQYGPPRTASTLQFQILCLMMVLLHEKEPRSVGCYFNRSPSHKYSVIKTHGIKYFFEALTQNAWIFMTAGSSLPESKWQRQGELIQQKLKYLNISVRYISDIDLVSKRGHFIAYEYQSIFGLSDGQMTLITEYLRYWDILRLCCGRQMSMDWRNRLSPIPGYKQHHDSHDRTYPACEMYNITLVEQLFIKTYINQRFAHMSVHGVIGRPSTVDGKLDGTYCERCNKNITMYHINETGQRCV